MNVWSHSNNVGRLGIPDIFIHFLQLLFQEFESGFFQTFFLVNYQIAQKTGLYYRELSVYRYVFYNIFFLLSSLQRIRSDSAKNKKCHAIKCQFPKIFLSQCLRQSGHPSYAMVICLGLGQLYTVPEKGALYSYTQLKKIGLEQSNCKSLSVWQHSYTTIIGSYRCL